MKNFTTKDYEIKEINETDIESGVKTKNINIELTEIR